MVPELGSWADWFAAVGGWGSIGTAIYLAVRESRRREKAEAQLEDLQHLYRTQTATRAIEQIDVALALLHQLGPSYNGPFGRPDASDCSRRIKESMSKVIELKAFAQSNPSLSFALKDAEAALANASEAVASKNGFFTERQRLSRVRERLGRLI